ncbi:MAG TPA: hypothetical protein VJ798_13235 [Rhizomicrobium sp.]|nr:hypothetical protein [Rhizomicrobium sp.]
MTELALTPLVVSHVAISLIAFHMRLALRPDRAGALRLPCPP